MAHRVNAQWHPTAIYSSPMQRCVQTAHEIATGGPIAAETLEELNDLDYGEWEWQTHEDVKTHFAEEYRLWRSAPQWVRFPKGESLQSLAERVADALRLILQRHANKTVVIVGHDSANRALLLHLFGLPLSAYWLFEQDPCGISEIDVSAEDAKALRINDTCHLSGISR